MPMYVAGTLCSMCTACNHVLIIVTTSILPSVQSCMPSPLVYEPLLEDDVKYQIVTPLNMVILNILSTSNSSYNG